jgi:uncharacterized protein YndB with AHSA1/START domain
MTDTITIHELRFERRLPAPVETVWRYLTDSDLRARWFMGGAIDARPGGKMEFVFDHDQLSDGDVPMPERFADKKGHRWTEEIIDIDPPHLIAYTFGTDSEGVVTFELAPSDDGGTLLTLVHSKIASREQALNYGGGWTAHLAVLEARLAGRGVPDFWALHRQCQDKVAAELDQV